MRHIRGATLDAMLSLFTAAAEKLQGLCSPCDWGYVTYIKNYVCVTCFVISDIFSHEKLSCHPTTTRGGVMPEFLEGLIWLV